MQVVPLYYQLKFAQNGGECHLKLIKDVEHIALEDRMLAMQFMNRLRAGNRVFGTPAEGLKQTLAHLERKQLELASQKGKLDFLDNDGDVRSEIALVKAGITGEEQLGEYLQRVVKYDSILEDMITFASVSDPEQDSGDGEYISDSDFVCVYGDRVMILDAKNIRTSPEMPIYLDGNTLVSVGGKPILELHPSTHVWKRIFERYGVELHSVHGCVVIVNQQGAVVWKNKVWHQSEVKPMHISDLVDFLHDWCDGVQPEVKLSTITTIGKMQIRKKRQLDMDVNAIRMRFNI